jgi:hypothetical protein
MIIASCTTPRLEAYRPLYSSCSRLDSLSHQKLPAPAGDASARVLLGYLTQVVTKMRAVHDLTLA